MKLPFERRSDDWVFGALLAAVLASAIGLNGAWVREVRVAHPAHPASAAPAVAGVPAAAPVHAAAAPVLTAAARPDLP